MNILYLNAKKNWGGISSWMQATALGLGKRGHRVWIISHPKALFTNKADKRLKIIPKRFGFNYSPFTIFTFVRFIRDKRIDLVLTNTEKEVISGGIAAKTCGIPNIRRNGNEADFNRKIRVRLHQKFLVNTNIVPCRNIIKQIKEKTPWINTNGFVVIYNGKPIQKHSKIQISEKKRNWGLKNNDFVIGVISQLTKDKNNDAVIEIFAKILTSHPKYKLVIVGEGKYKQELIDKTKKLEIEKNVCFTGFDDNPRLAASAFDISISNSNIEGFPNTVVEYLSVGCATIATNVGGVSEIIKNGTNGILIEPNNSKMLYDNVIKLIEDKNLRSRLARNALKTVKEKFNESIMVDEVERVFRIVSKK